MFKIDTFAYNVYFNISMHLLNENYILDSAQGRVSFRIYGTETSGIAAIRAEGAAYPYNKKSPPMARKADKKSARRGIRKLPKIPPGQGKGSI